MSTPSTPQVTPRTIRVLPAPADLPFPHVNPGLADRTLYHRPGRPPLSAVAALGVTSLSADRAGPDLLATLVRQHWGIEALHWQRDILYREDTPPPAPDPSPV